MGITLLRERIALLISVLIAFGLAPFLPEFDFTVGFLCGAICPFLESALGDPDANTEGSVWLFIVAFFVGLLLLFSVYRAKGMVLLSYSTGAMASHLYLFLRAKRRNA
ncbi:hypothetical protein FJ444_15320 [Aestuariibacter sp. GS-14]|uniref:hypothetical protein n=1 Tax=Aestuariibacter sp. GS-14 TaxID=2590670 RepID=UPI0011276EF7|nr:hypothetical protein [Aestuariibacter sp. GS-14]TPV56004.1 hypothetical protein FJ444_15320 [Aestuariibacter sp. GS-14]